jgi:peptidoglycan DL-endopeptidase CwlO
MRKIILSLFLISFFLGGCSLKDRNNSLESPHTELEGKHMDGYTFPSDEELNAMQDNKLNDPSILNDDELLSVGDTELDKMIKQVQNPPNEYDQKMLKKMSNSNQELTPMNVHHSWKNPQIHQVFLNTNIKPINGSYVNNVVGKAWDYYGTPYELGSNRNTDTTFDCSDFVRWVHLWTLGMDLPKTSSSQYEYVKKFSNRHYTDLSQAKRGDVLFFMSYKGWKPEDYNGINVKAQPVAHDGIYVGNGIIVHTASKKTGGVRFDKIKGSHLEYRFIGGGNIIQ